MDRNQDVEVELYEENVGNLNYSTPTGSRSSSQDRFPSVLSSQEPTQRRVEENPLWLSIRGPILKNCLMLQLLKCPGYTIVVTVAPERGSRMKISQVVTMSREREARMKISHIEDRHLYLNLRWIINLHWIINQSINQKNI